jgi:hypothetical protein
MMKQCLLLKNGVSVDADINPQVYILAPGFTATRRVDSVGVVSVGKHPEVKIRVWVKRELCGVITYCITNLSL